MSIKTHTLSDALVFEPECSRLDVQSVTAFKDSVVGQLIPGKNVVLDLHTVLFIDSTGLGALLSLLRLVKKTGDTLVLAHVSEQTLAMFRLVKMNRIFDIYASTEEAVMALKD